MKLAPCLVVGSLLFDVGFSIFANPPAQETVQPALSDCEESFQAESLLAPVADSGPELRIFPQPVEVREPLNVPSYAFLISDKDVPDILNYLDQLLEVLTHEPDNHEVSRQTHRLIVRLHAWLRGPFQQVDIQTYILHVAEPSIAQISRVEKVGVKEKRFAEVEPLLPKIVELIDDVEFDLGLRTRALMLKREFEGMRVETQMTEHANALISMSLETKWNELNLLEESLEQDDVQPLQRKADILKLAALYTDPDILKRLMQLDEMNGWGARLATLDKRIAEAIVIYGFEDLAQLPSFLSETIDGKFDRIWRWQRSRQVVYFSGQLTKLREQYDAPLPYTEKSRLIDQFLARYDSEQLARMDAHKHIAVITDLIEKTAIQWKSRDPLEKAEAGRALWTAIRLISVF